MQRVVKPVLLRPSDQGIEISLDDFEHARGVEGYRYELIDGRVNVSPAPELPHDDLTDWVADLLRDYSRSRPRVINRISLHSRVHVPGRRSGTCPEPDISAYRNYPRHLARRLLRWRDISPLIVVEVISEDNPLKDLFRNVDLYLQVPSIREYWILDPRPDPDRPTLTVYRRRGQRWQKPIVVPFGGTYETRLLPGFKLVVDPG